MIGRIIGFVLVVVAVVLYIAIVLAAYYDGVRKERERDSLIEDLKETGKACRYCRHFMNSYNAPPCDECEGYRLWEYRGPRKK